MPSGEVALANFDAAAVSGATAGTASWRAPLTGAAGAGGSGGAVAGALGVGVCPLAPVLPLAAPVLPCFAAVALPPC